MLALVVAVNVGVWGVATARISHSITCDDHEALRNYYMAVKAARAGDEARAARMFEASLEQVCSRTCEDEDTLGQLNKNLVIECWIAEYHRALAAHAAKHDRPRRCVDEYDEALRLQPDLEPSLRPLRAACATALASR